MTVIIGLHGAKGSGKDYFYESLVAKYPDKDIRKIAFADPIKQKVMFIFGLHDEAAYDEFKRTSVNFDLHNSRFFQSGRHIVREIGMLMRSYDPHQFTTYVRNEIEKAPDAIWCITDVRFGNEVCLLELMGGKIVKIRREGVHFDGHASETELDDEWCHYIIDNDMFFEDTACQLLETITKAST